MNKKSYLAGLKAGFPVLFGFIPIGIAYAVTAQQRGFSPKEIVSLSMFVFAGGSQIMAVEMFSKNASILAIIIVTFVLNFRHLIMSICIMNKLKKDSLIYKIIASYFITDESFAVFTTENEKNQNLSFYFGIITITYSSWVLGAVLGCIVSKFLPTIFSDSLGIALYSLFLALIIPSAKKNISLIGLLIFTGIVNYILNLFLLSSYALIITTIFCAFVGVYFVKEGEENEK